METIKSFLIDHDKHPQGFYLSGESQGIYTYDLRFKIPNGGDYLGIAAMHTIEHLFATVVRNSEKKENVVYFGPMGCRTGFYLLLRDIAPADALPLVIDCLKKCLELDFIPGSKKKECGNYKSHNLKGAKIELTKYLLLLEEKYK